MDNHSHYIWGFVAVVAIGVVAWCYSANRPDVTNNAKGAMPVSTEINHYSAIDVNPCGVLFKVGADKPKEEKKK